MPKDWAMYGIGRFSILLNRFQNKSSGFKLDSGNKVNIKMALRTSYIKATRDDKTNTFSGDVTLKTGAQETIKFYGAGNQTAANKKAGVIVGVAGVVTDIRAYLDTAPTGATLIIDVNKNGTTMYTTQDNRAIVAIDANASSTTLPDVTTVAAGDRITYDIDQVGSGTAGAGLYLSVTITRKTV